MWIVVNEVVVEPVVLCFEKECGMRVWIGRCSSVNCFMVEV